MQLKAIIVASFVFSGCSTAVADDDDDLQGSFQGQVSDGSELVKYNAFLDQLASHKIWLALGSFLESSSAVSFKSYNAAKEIYISIVKENGGADIPVYASDTLALRDIAGYRTYAQNAISTPSFKATAETCGAAVTFVYPAAVSVMLFDKRPVYATGQKRSGAELTALGNKYGAQLSKDLATLNALCAGQDPSVFSGFGAFLQNFSADVDRVLPLVDKDYVSTQYPYTATFSCGVNGRSLSVLACFNETDLKITTAEGGRLYKVYDLQRAGVIDQQGLHLQLPEHFELQAQNSQRTLVLTVSIKDSAGKEVYTDQQGHYGIIRGQN
jgi:hypothetical protein